MPLEARPSVFLFKRFQTLRGGRDPRLRAGARARRIPHVLVRRTVVPDREEVMAVRSALLAIEWPDDELNVYADAARAPLRADRTTCSCSTEDRFRRLAPAVSTRRTAGRVDLAGGGRGDGRSGRSRRRSRCSGELHRERNRRPIAGHPRRAPRRDARARGHRDLADGGASARERARG